MNVSLNYMRYKNNSLTNWSIIMIMLVAEVTVAIINQIFRQLFSVNSNKALNETAHAILVRVHIWRMDWSTMQSS